MFQSEGKESRKQGSAKKELDSGEGVALERAEMWVSYQLLITGEGCISSPSSRVESAPAGPSGTNHAT